MLDVHPPHHAASSRRDFLVHIATIVVGLLIAVGLEQTVELLHKHEERATLREDLHAEAERNVPKLQADLQSFGSDGAWMRQILHQLAQARSSGDQVVVTVEPRKIPAVPRMAPMRSVWQLAQLNGKAGLLPDAEAQMFARQDYEEEEFLKALDDMSKPINALNALTERLEVEPEPGQALHLKYADREELARCVADVLAALATVRHFTAGSLGAAEAVVQGVHTRDEMDESIRKAFSAE